MAVVCGRTRRAADDALAVVNPILLAEITSTSTEDYDRGEKLRQYQILPSVREILLVSHREPLITLYGRTRDGWSELRAGPGETVALECVSARITVDEIYRDALEDTAPGEQRVSE